MSYVLVGGVLDGHEVPYAPGGNIQWADPDFWNREPPIVYTARKWFSSWPIPGWEPVLSDLDDISRPFPLGKSIAWRVRALYHPDRIIEIQDFINRSQWMELVARAYYQHDSDFIQKHMNKALEEARQLSALTLPERKS
jgi:hypothetical protein